MNLLRIVRSGLTLAALAALAACSGGPSRPGVGTAPPAVSTAAEIETAVGLLNRGEHKDARKRLRAVLKREPMNASAKLLLDSIEGNAQEQLGPRSFAYTVRPGDTMAELADRFLGNRLKFYQLARYNGLENPSALTAGQSIRIPGEAPRPPAPRPEPQRPSTPSTRPTPAPTPAPAPVKPAGNPAAARQARAAGLAALNQGKVAQAVTLLRRAAALDPGNPVIARDLARAERIAATVRARR